MDRLDDPSESGVQSRLSPSSHGPKKAGAEIDVELDEELELSLESTMALGKGVAPGAPRSRPAAPKRQVAKPKPSRPRPAPTAAQGDTRSTESSVTNAFLSLDPTQLRHLVAVQPELLEAGLVVYVDESGNEVGAQFETEAGEIDLLARDEAGGLVVVMVPDRDAGRDTISDMLQRIGWVRKHLAGAGKPVRGIVLLESLDEEIGYAASAVSDTIDFKTWRLSLAFDLIEL